MNILKNKSNDTASMRTTELPYVFCIGPLVGIYIVFHRNGKIQETLSDAQTSELGVLEDSIYIKKDAYLNATFSCR